MTGKLLFTPRFQIAAVFTTGLLKFLLVDIFEFRALFITLAVGFWLIYMLVSVRNDRAFLKRIGFRREGLKETFTATGILFLLSTVAFFIYAWQSDNFVLNHNLWPVLALYPLWGLLQQALVMGFVANNLQSLGKGKLFIVVFTSLAFSLVHLPDVTLTIGTFALAMVYTSIYMKWKNLWPLGLFHGWLGGFFYFLVLRIDPWQRMLQTIH